MDNREALKTFMTGENFYLQHYLGAHREELNGEHGAIPSVFGHLMLRLFTWLVILPWIENQIPIW